MTDRPILKVIFPWPHRHPNGTPYLSGATLEYQTLMENYLNFNTEIIADDELAWGSMLPNGSFNGMIGMINRSEVAFGVGPFTLGPARAQAIDFTFPTRFDNNVILTPRPKLESDMLGMLKAFPIELWLLILASLVVTPIALMFTESLEGKIFHFRTKSLPGKAIIWAIKAITQEGSDWLPDMAASRIVVGTWLLAGLVIVSAFSGILIAMLTLPKVTIPIDSVEDLVKQNEIPWLLMEHAHFTKYLKTSENPYLRLAFERVSRFIKYPRINFTTEDGMAQFMVGWRAHYLMETDFKKVGYCRMYVAKERVDQDVVGMAFGKGSPYLEKVNILFMRMLERGIVEKMYQYDNRCKHSPIKDRPSGISSLDVTSFGGPFVILAIGLLLSTLVFIFEYASQFFNKPKESSERY